MAEEPDGESSVLRVAVQGGGCSGFEYALGFDSGVQEGDDELSTHGVTVVVDPFSAPYLQGAEIDYLERSRSRASRSRTRTPSPSCGCGHSFQVADGEAPEDGAGGCGSGCSTSSHVPRP